MKKDIDIYFYVLGFFVVLYVGLHLGYAMEINSEEHKTFTDIVTIFNKNIFKDYFIFLQTIGNKKQTAIIPFVSIFFFWIYIMSDMANKKKFRRKGSEHGSGRWGTIKESKVFRDKKKFENFILSKNIHLSTNQRKTRLNLNTIVFGGAGTGKSRYVVTPNVLQANSSFVITDPKGSLLKNLGAFLKNQGYVIKIFNLVDMEYSHKYNPFCYIAKEEEIYILIDNLIKNTDGGAEAKKNKGDPFWENSEKALFSCIMFYLWKYKSPEEQKFSKVLEIVQNFENEEHEDVKAIRGLPGDDISKLNYETVMLSGDKTLANILVSSAIRLSLMNLDAVKNLMEKDEMEILNIGDEKTALFIIIPDTSSTFNFLASMLYTQLFQKLIYKADHEKTEQLNIHTRFIIDEFANVGQIPDIEKLFATVRSRNISITAILQDLTQLKNLYEKTWESIIGNCNSFIFLGGTEPALLKYISEKLGKETIHAKNRGTSKSKQKSVSYNENILARSLMNPDELENLDKKLSIVSVLGQRSFLDEKYILKNHPQYKHLAEVNKDNLYMLKNEFEKTQEIQTNSSGNLYRVKNLDFDVQKGIKLLHINEDDEIIQNDILIEIMRASVGDAIAEEEKNKKAVIRSENAKAEAVAKEIFAVKEAQAVKKTIAETGGAEEAEETEGAVKTEPDQEIRISF